MKTALKARGGDWIQELPIILLGLRAIPNESGSSPFTTVTGTSLLLPAVQKGKSTDVGYIKDLARMMKTVDFTTLSSWSASVVYSKAASIFFTHLAEN